MSSHTCINASNPLVQQPPCPACQDDYLAKLRLVDEERGLKDAIVDAAMECTVVVTGTFRDRIGHANVTLDRLGAACAALRTFREKGGG